MIYKENERFAKSYEYERIKMNKIKTALIILALSISAAYAQELPDFLRAEKGDNFETKHVFCSRHDHFHYHAKDKNAPFGYFDESQIERRVYDVVHYDLYLDWYPCMSKIGNENEDRYWTGKNIITIRIDSSDVDELVFDALGLRIDRVLVDGEAVSVGTLPDEDYFELRLNETYGPGDTLEVEIDYTFTDHFNGNSYSCGFFLYPKNHFVGRDTTMIETDIYVEERIAYTQSEPELGRTWFPSNDNPYDKALADIRIRVPLQYTAASNGLLAGIESDDTSRTFHWKVDLPIPTYLMVANASIFKTWTEKHVRATNPQDTIDLQYYVWESDYSSTITDYRVFNAKSSFERTSDILTAYSEYFCEYPFKKYGMVAVQPYGFGGMEHQSLTTVNRTWLRGYAESGIAHEAAHQWIGDYITCATWKEIWINEGGATWGEALWNEYKWGRNSYLSTMRTKARQYFRLNRQRPIYNPPLWDVFNYYLSYAKSSWIYHMLRTHYGDDAFFPALRDMLDQYAYSSLETKDFYESFKKSLEDPIVDMDTFFRQWIFSAGHPKLIVQTNASQIAEDEYRLRVDFTQIQSGEEIPEAFVAPFRIEFYDTGEETVFIDTLLVEERSQSFELTLPFLPDSFAVDDSFTLCEIMDATLSAKPIFDAEFADEIVVVPNPAVSGSRATAQMSIAAPANLKIALYDRLGGKIRNIYDGFLPAGSYEFGISTRNLTSDVYFIVADFGDRIATARFIISK